MKITKQVVCVFLIAGLLMLAVSALQLPAVRAQQAGENSEEATSDSGARDNEDQEHGEQSGASVQQDQENGDDSEQRELTADNITVNTIEGEEAQRIVAEGNVVMISDELEIRGESAQFHTGTEDLMVETDVRLLRQDYTVTGDKLSGNLGQEQYEITGNVRSEGPQVRTKSGYLFYDVTAGEMILKQDPYIEYDTLEAHADKITYMVNEDMAYLEGNVRGTEKDRKFSAEEITVDNTGDEIQLKGQASLTIPGGSGQ